MIDHYLLEVSLNHVACIFKKGFSSRFRKYQVLIKYVVTNNETEAFLHPYHLLRNKRDTANFDLEKPNFCQLLNLYFSFYLFGNLIQNDNFSGEIFAIYFIFLKGVVFRNIII